MAFTFYPVVAIFAVLVNEECTRLKEGQKQICYERSEFQFCLCGSEAGGLMESGSMARGVMEPPAIAALFQRVYMLFCFQQQSRPIDQPSDMLLLGA